MNSFMKAVKEYPVPLVNDDAETLYTIVDTAEEALEVLEAAGVLKRNILTPGMNVNMDELAGESL